MKPERAFLPGDILLPKNCDNTKWSVVACDQYTSEPSYWDAVEQFVGDAPSTYHMIVPEIYLEDPDVSERIEAVNQNMDRYLAQNILEEISSFLYVERTLKNGKVRKGIVGVIDLEAYDYQKGAQSMVRATAVSYTHLDVYKRQAEISRLWRRLLQSARILRFIPETTI